MLYFLNFMFFVMFLNVKYNEKNKLANNLKDYMGSHVFINEERIKN